MERETGAVKVKIPVPGLHCQTCQRTLYPATPGWSYIAITPKDSTTPAKELPECSFCRKKRVSKE